MSTPEVQRFDGEWIRGEMQLSGEGLETAAMAWLSYTETIQFILPVFEEFDPLHSGPFLFLQICLRFSTR
jgi:hypothetical protein